MSNRVEEGTVAFIQATLQQTPEVVRKAKESAKRHSEHTYGLTLSLEEQMNLAKAVKFIVETDGLSAPESTALHAILEHFGAPQQFVEHIEEFDTHAVDFGDVAALFPQGSDHARRLLDGVIAVAIADGIARKEHKAIQELARKLGVSKKLARVHEARMNVAMLARELGNAELSERLAALRHAIWDLD